MLANLLKEVGRGKRGARDLSGDEARQAAELIIGGKATAAQIGAFLIAERIKMESVDELEAFVHVLREHACRSGNREGIDCAGPYDGRKKTFFATIATSFVLGAAGLPVTLHGTASLPPKWGVTQRDIWTAAGIDTDRLHEDDLLRIAGETGILYVPSERWCPPLQQLESIRKELGMRTVLNTAEKLVDYSHSPYLLFGVFHNTVFERIAELANRLGYKRALIVQGMEGSEDLFIERPTRTYYVDRGEARLQVIDPDSYGLEITPPELEWTPALQLETTEAVLRGEGHLAFVHGVLLNAAVRLHLAEKTNSIEEGLYICKALLDEGAPWQLYRKWKELMRKT
ncbi:anthranilate phosphoribosyltransferase [Paenibacillus sp. 1011MAR3C5]|uniref:anthranilate phosphoribosyltransferase n=1 Tax=Paenibacillus sp. 1011MAR3C5 TaxID=1675787 RepID=UPI000E6CCA74|nr:anthranilate phosphoribosyltransferase [Paenibacillus sp. 1011MAR3C5]RJE88669.1 anthranilate phosphoribosyltransferase [Paenibacillus sp. 1011MAR3C5]